MSSDSSAREWKRLEPTEPVTIPCAWSHGAGVGARLSSSVAPKLRRRRARSSAGSGRREDAAAAGSGGEGQPVPAVTRARCWQRSGRRRWQQAGTEPVLARQSSSSARQGLGQGAAPGGSPCCGQGGRGFMHGLGAAVAASAPRQPGPSLKGGAQLGKPSVQPRYRQALHPPAAHPASAHVGRGRLF